MAKNILKEAIADAKAVREVALANAKSALEEAFTPKLQSILSTKLEEDMYYDEDEKDDVEEMYYDEDDDMDEMHDDMQDEDESSMYEEIDLEEILNELELEGDEAEKETEDDEEDIEEGYQSKTYAQADDVQNVTYKSTNIYENDKEFDLDELLSEINNLEEDRMPPVNTISSPKGMARKGMKVAKKKGMTRKGMKVSMSENRSLGCSDKISELNKTKKELQESLKAFETVKGELNEVNLLNSKLLYVNRIFKANTLDDAQKLRVVETLDKADSTKEAKLIYETIKDTFNVANATKVSKKSKTRSLKENFKGMASKAAGNSTAPKREVIAESTEMVNRFQKLANIKISE